MKKILALTGASVFALTLATDAQAHKRDKNAELKAEVARLMERVNELEAKKNVRADDAVTDGSDKLKLVISGQVNRAVLWHNDGSHSNVVHVDPSAEAGTRLNIAATSEVSNGLKAGATMQVNMRSNRAENTDVKNANDANSTFNKRIVEVFLDHERWGKATMGYGFMAGARVMRDTDMSNTDAVSLGDSVGQIAGGTQFTQTNLASQPLNTNKATNAALTPLTIVNVFNGNGAENGLGDRFMYETPEYWGTKLSFSHVYKGNNDKYDFALKHACEISDVKLAVQIAYLRDLANGTGTQAAGTFNPEKYHQWSGSVGAYFANGISVMLATAHRNWQLKNAPRGNIYFGKLGYEAKFFEAGLTSFAIDYGRYKNMMLNRGAADAFIKNTILGKTYGVTLVQHLDRIGTDVYGTVRRYTLDADLQGLATNPAGHRDISVVMAGARVKF